jgi:hypothetical protein
VRRSPPFAGFTTTLQHSSLLGICALRCHLHVIRDHLRTLRFTLGCYLGRLVHGSVLAFTCSTFYPPTSTNVLPTVRMLWLQCADYVLSLQLRVTQSVFMWTLRQHWSSTGLTIRCITPSTHTTTTQPALLQTVALWGPWAAIGSPAAFVAGRLLLHYSNSNTTTTTNPASVAPLSVMPSAAPSSAVPKTDNIYNFTSATATTPSTLTTTTLPALHTVAFCWPWAAIGSPAAFVAGRYYTTRHHSSTYCSDRCPLLGHGRPLDRLQHSWLDGLTTPLPIQTLRQQPG